MNSERLGSVLGPVDEIDVLMKEYGFIKAEMQTYITLFHGHTNLMTVLLASFTAVTLGIATVIARVDPALFVVLLEFKVHVGSKIFLVYQLLLMLSFMLIATWGFYSASASFSYIYLVELLANRARAIEVMVNGLAGKRLLCWEIAISPALIRMSGSPVRWIPPSTYRIGWAYVAFLLIIAFSITVAVPMLGNLFGIIYILYALTGISTVLRLFVRYRRVMLPDITRIVAAESSL